MVMEQSWSGHGAFIGAFMEWSWSGHRVVSRSQTTFFSFILGREKRVWNTEQQLLVPLIHNSAGVLIGNDDHQSRC